MKPLLGKFTNDKLQGTKNRANTDDKLNFKSLPKELCKNA